MKYKWKKVMAWLLIVLMAAGVLGETTYSGYHAGSLDDVLWMIEEELSNGNYSEEYVLTEIIEENGFSQKTVKKLLDDGYCRQYVDRLKAGGWLPMDYEVPSNAPSGSNNQGTGSGGSNTSGGSAGSSNNGGSNTSSSDTSLGTSTEVTYTQEEIDNAWVEKKRVEATCTEVGYIQYKNKLTGKSKKEEIPVLEHTYKAEIQKEATCVELGSKLYTCEGCGNSYTEDILMVEHNYQPVERQEPTCTVEGTQGYKCSDCSKSYEDVIEATGHDEGEWVVVKKPTAFKEGKKILHCTKCNVILETEITEKKGLFQAIFDFLFGWMKDSNKEENSEISTEINTEMNTETETNIPTETTETGEVLTFEVSERNKIYRSHLESEVKIGDKVFFKAYMFNIVDINSDGVPEIICNTNDETAEHANIITIWNGDHFLGGFESMTYCTMTYSPSKGVFMICDYNTGPDFDSREWISVYEIDESVITGVKEVASFIMEEKDGKVTYRIFSNSQEIKVDKAEYTERVNEYRADEIVLDTPYAITKENLDMLLPILE